MIEQHLKACTPQMEEEGQRIDRRNKHPFRIISPSAVSPDPSHCPIFNFLPHISEHRDNMGEGKNLQITMPLGGGGINKRTYSISDC